MLVHEISSYVSPQVADAIQSAIENIHQVWFSGYAAVISILITVVTASILFVQLKRAINFMWGIVPHPGKRLHITLRTHFLSFIMVLVTGVLLLTAMVVSTALVSFNQRLHLLYPAIDAVLPDGDFGLIFIGFTLLFALIFKTLPDAHIAWKDVWLGAVVTGVLFTLGEYLIGYYLGRINLGVYGAVGSIFLILLWVYYTMQIILFGAKFTQVYANRHGSRLKPSVRAGLVVYPKIGRSEVKQLDEGNPKL
jgi:membrane protein